MSLFPNLEYCNTVLIGLGRVQKKLTDAFYGCERDRKTSCFSGVFTTVKRDAVF